MADYLSATQWGRIFAKAWLDESFKAHLESDPRSAIAAHRDELGIPEDFLVQKMPSKPADYTDKQLEEIRKGAMPLHAADGLQAMYCC
jgi:hypothetical protein